MRKPKTFLVLLLSILFSGCSSILNNLPFVYTLDIQQGNVINQKMIDQLRPKMTKRQVLYIMGSSMLVDVFHPKRWDYLYSEQLSGEQRKQKRLSLFFEGDVLVGIQGDFKPSSEPVARKSENITIDVPPRDLEKTLWEKITGLFSDDTPVLPEHKTEKINPLAIQTVPNNQPPETATEAVKKKENKIPPLDEGNQKILEKATNSKKPIVTESEKKTTEVAKSKTISITPLEKEKPQILEKIDHQNKKLYRSAFVPW